MTVLSDLTAEISSQLPTGVSHEITAAKLRTVLADMATKIIASQAVTGGGGGGGGSAERYLISNTTANAGDICFCNTQAGGFTITLPDTPVPGMGVGFRDAESSWNASNLTIFPGTNKIENASGSLVCDVTNGNFDLVWSGSAEGWQVVPIISFVAGTGGGTGTGSSYIYVSANGTVPVGAIAYCDTTSGSFTAILPTSPVLGNGISFRDFAGTWGLSHLILNPGTNAINSNSGSFTVDQQDINFDLVWRGPPIGWQIMVPIFDALRGTAVDRIIGTQTLAAIGQTATATRGGGTVVTWNPSDRSANNALSGGNLICTAVATASRGIRATAPGSPNRYFEVTWTTAVGTGAAVALSNTTQSLGGATLGDPNSVAFYASGYVEWPGSGTGNNWGGTWTTGDVIGVVLGTGNAKLFKNGTLAYTVNTLPSGALYPFLWLTTAGESTTANFGATTMAFLPAGMQSWDGSRGAGTTTTTTWNSLDQSGVTLSNSNLTATGTGTGGGQVRATRANTAGHYFELHIDAGASSGVVYVGIANLSQSILSGFASDPNGICYFNNGYAAWPGGSGSGAGYTTGDTIGVRLLSGNVEFYKNGTLQFTSGGIPSGALYPMIGVYDVTGAITANFGATSFANLPSGATGWNS